MDDQHSAASEPLSRTAYRNQQRRAQPGGTERLAPSDPNLHREQMVNGQEKLTATEKTARLKKRLNIAIVCLIVAIIVVYLILFFVG